MVWIVETGTQWVVVFTDLIHLDDCQCPLVYWTPSVPFSKRASVAAGYQYSPQGIDESLKWFKFVHFNSWLWQLKTHGHNATFGYTCNLINVRNHTNKHAFLIKYLVQQFVSYNVLNMLKKFVNETITLVGKGLSWKCAHFMQIRWKCTHFLAFSGKCMHFMQIRWKCAHFLAFSGKCTHFMQIRWKCTHFLALSGKYAHFMQIRWKCAHFQENVRILCKLGENVCFLCKLGENACIFTENARIFNKIKIWTIWGLGDWPI